MTDGGDERARRRRARRCPPKLLKKSRVLSENPLSKMMGGRSRKKKISSLKSTHSVTLPLVFAAHSASPTPMPISSAAPSLVEEGDLKVLDHQPEHERAREAHEQEQERRGLELVRLRGGRAAGVRVVEVVRVAHRARRSDRVVPSPDPPRARLCGGSRRGTRTSTRRHATTTSPVSG